jgi:hypothetical protein
MSAASLPPSRLWWLAAGFGIWWTALVALYAVHAIGCAFAWSAGPLWLGLAALLAAHLIVIGWMWHALAAASRNSSFGQTGPFLHAVAIWTLLAAWATIILTLGPPLLLPMCVTGAYSFEPFPPLTAASPRHPERPLEIVA